MESHCEISTSWVYILKTSIITISRNRATESRFNLLRNQLTEVSQGMYFILSQRTDNPYFDMPQKHCLFTIS